MWAALGELAKRALKRNAKKTLAGAAQGDEASKRKIAIAGLIAFLMTVFPFILLVILVFGPILLTGQFIEDYNNEKSLFFSKVGNLLTLNGWCSDLDGSCEQKAEQKYLNEINRVYRKYKKIGVDLDTDLITGTIFYGSSMYGDKFSDITVNINTDNIDDIDTEEKWIESLTFSKEEEYYHKYSSVDLHDITLLSKKLVKNFKMDYDGYYEYLKSTYIPHRFSEFCDNGNDERKIKIIADQIMLYAKKSYSESSTCNVVNTSCSGVTISSGDYAGTYTLEEYVAGVLSHEVGSGWPDEALKAQAVAARTFVLKYTDNCTKSIPNNTNAQTFSPTTDEKLIKAVNDTSGVVLTVDDNVINSEYASWWGNNRDSSCGAYQNCSNGQCSIDLYKLPNNEKWTFTMPQNYFAWGDVTDKIQMSDSAIQGLGGHCRGMSRFGAKYLDLGEHYQYNKILNTFYSPNVKISTFGNSTNTCSPGLVANGIVGSNYKNFMQRVSAPTGSDYYYSQDYFYSGNVGQCVWYVQRRALEIMNTVDIDEELRQKAVTALLNTGGNGRDWWDNPSLTMFGYSTDYSQPKVGSIIVWRYTQANINNHNGYDYGHVAIVEAVDYENKTMTVSDGWKNDWSKPNSIEYASFGFRTVPFEWALDAGNASNYIYMGYVYLLD